MENSGNDGLTEECMAEAGSFDVISRADVLFGTLGRFLNPKNNKVNSSDRPGMLVNMNSGWRTGRYKW